MLRHRCRQTERELNTHTQTHNVRLCKKIWERHRKTSKVEKAHAHKRREKMHTLR